MGVYKRTAGSRSAIHALRKARAALANATPQRLDCGELCGRACCLACGNGENGMLLWPFEAQFYSSAIDGFPFLLKPDDTLYAGGSRLVCEGTCPREHRPLSCRMFPLRLSAMADDKGMITSAAIEIDPRAWALCPLPEKGGLGAMDKAFMAAMEKAGQAMFGSAHLLKALLREQRMIDAMRRFPNQNAEQEGEH